MNGEHSSTSGNLVGTVLLGRYRVVRELAKGGMGIVYLARAEGAVGFVKPYVIKLVLPEHADNQRFIAMFVREANILSNLRHPGIVSVIELGEREEDGALVMVLEYVRGYHLGQWAKYVRLKQRVLPVQVLLLLMIDVLDALHYAHSMVHPDGTPMHIVHRDISPSNILLDEDGRARLLDFGVARMRGGENEYHTQVKGFVGKLMYSAPELFGEADATAQSDCYSCAVVLHEILMGRNVFRGDNQAATLNRVLNHLPEPIEPRRNDVPPGLDAVLKKALAKAPQDRIASAREFAAALRPLLSEPESDIRARIAELLKADFGQDMAEMLGLESLADRDEAWRRLSHSPLTRGSEPDSRPGASDGTGRSLLTPRLRPQHGTLRPPPDVNAGRPRVAGGSLRPPQDSARARVPPPPPPTALRAQGSVATAGHTPSAAFQALVDTRRALAVPVMITGLMVAGGLVTALVFAWSRQTAKSTAEVPEIRVVTESGGITPPPGQPSVTALTPGIDDPPELASAPVLDSASASDTPEPAPSERRERSAKPDPVSLTRAFRKQQEKIEACFAAHAVTVQGLPRMQLEFDLSTSGRPDNVRVQPSTLAETPLGRCLAQVASATHFPAQSRAISFAIPITASRSGSR